MILVDVHSHLCDNKYDGTEDEIVESFLKSGGEFMINSGFDIPSSVKSAEQAEKYGCVYFSRFCVRSCGNNDVCDCGRFVLRHF